MAVTPFTPPHVSLARARHLPTPNEKGGGKAVGPHGQRKRIRISANPTDGRCTDPQGQGACGWAPELSTCCWWTRQKLREVAGQGEKPYKAGAGARRMVGIRVLKLGSRLSLQPESGIGLEQKAGLTLG